MKIIIKVVASRLEGRDVYHRRLARAHDLFAIELEAFKLDGFLACIEQFDYEPLIRSDGKVLGRKAAIFKKLNSSFSAVPAFIGVASNWNILS